MGKKGKKKKNVEPEREPVPDDLKDYSIPMLKDRIEAFNHRLMKAMKDRNYMQLEKDMVNRFYEITKGEVGQIEAELLTMDRQMEMLERDHRVHIKVHEQRVQNLEYEHKNAKGQVNAGGDMSIQQEREMHKERVLTMNSEKLNIKRDLKEQQLENEDDVKMMCQ